MKNQPLHSKKYCISAILMSQSIFLLIWHLLLKRWAIDSFEENESGFKSIVLILPYICMILTAPIQYFHARYGFENGMSKLTSKFGL